MNRIDEKTKDPAQSPWVGSPVKEMRMDSNDHPDNADTDTATEAFNLDNQLAFNRGTSATITRVKTGYQVTINNPKLNCGSIDKMNTLREALDAVTDEYLRDDSEGGGP